MAKKPLEHTPKTEAEKTVLDAAIVEQQKITDHEIREFPISVIVDKFQTGLEEDKAELYIPDYQREFVWSDFQKSRFIESLLLNLPIPYIFVADIGEGENEGRLEIVDGSQRVRTLHQFINNNLTLSDLERLTSANGFKYSDFSAPRKMRFDRKTIRMIELTDKCDEETRREIFDRLNTGGIELNTMEQRQGSNDGPFLAFINGLADDATFQHICPIGNERRRRAEYSELVLRYFAYSECYLDFKKSVKAFLTDFLKEKNENYATINTENLQSEFNAMCAFVARNFPGGFRKTLTANTVPRIRFEAIAVGTTLALRQQPDLTPPNIEEWIGSRDFITHTRSDASNSRPKVKARIEYVRDKLLGNDPQPIHEIEEDDDGEVS
ncbi:hypothetical protein BFS14_22690 [Serratia fonticola]|uniref:DUF262 domain-containing protein n=1 Tax=Serratia fonticola TaxID=47917 RepID=UPI0008FD8885|nr:DUF262 domain-containing protein [Serratia fonticola]OIX91510.1 hypothetical protein BFS14_22690 [Serratia fonticola]QCR63209.1 DUF262 domain-containing protein [Serratia fonticola]